MIHSFIHSFIHSMVSMVLLNCYTSARFTSHIGPTVTYILQSETITERILNNRTN